MLSAPESSSRTPSGGLVEAYSRFLFRHHRWVLACWAVAVCVGAPLAKLFIDNCTDVFEAPDGSSSAEAKALLLKGGLDIVRYKTTVVIVTPTGNFSVVDSGLAAFEQGLHCLVMGPSRGNGPCDDAYNIGNHKYPKGKGTIMTWQGYTDAEALSPTLAQQVLAPGGKASLISIQQDPSKHGVDKEFAEFMADALQQQMSRHPRLHAEQTGYGPIALDAITGTEKDLGKMDSIALPLALLVLSLVLNSWKVMLIPPAAIVGSICLSLGVMYPVSLAVTTIAFVPSVMMSCTIAFSFDYSLFVLSRYREELGSGATVEEAIRTTLQKAGHTVLMSGGTLAFAFAMMCLFPVVILNSMGVGAAVAVLSTIASNLSLTPSLLLLFPDFFKDEQSLATADQLWPVTLYRKCRGLPDKAVETSLTAKIDTDLDRPEQSQPTAVSRKVTQGAWYRLAGRVQERRWWCIGIAVLVTIPFAIIVPKNVPLFSLQFVAPRGAPSWETFESVQQHFGAGVTFPYALAIQAKSGKVTSPGCFARTQQVVADVRAASDQVYEVVGPIHADYTGIMVASPLSKAAEAYEPQLAQLQLLLEWFTANQNKTVCEVVPLGPLACAMPMASQTLGQLLGNVEDVASQVVATALGLPHNSTELAPQLSCPGFPKSGCVPYAVFAIPAGCHRQHSGAWVCDPPSRLPYNCSGGVASQLRNAPAVQLAIKMLNLACPIPGVCSKVGPTGCCDINVTAAVEQALDLGRQACEMVKMLYSTQVSADQSITYLGVTLNVDPFTPSSMKGTDHEPGWLGNVRKKLDEVDKVPGSQELFRMGMGASAIQDAADAALSRFPMLILLTNGTVLLFLGYFFRSAVIPLRAIVSIGITLCIVYGLAVCVYQYGFLDWLHAPQVADWHGIAWLVPLMTFSIITGLGLDYDIFLLDRIVEMRQAGHSDDESISLGIAHTGRIITAAGTIMAVAFSGMLLSSSSTINMLSFYLTLAVILDTFVVRTILVPAMMYVLGPWNWWPKKYD